MRVALVNTNRMRPAIAPIGLDYVAEALHAAGHSVELLDLCWEEDARAAISKFFGRTSFGLTGVTLRNTDDCSFLCGQSFLAEFAGVVAELRAHTDALIVAGGVGFSVMPEQVLALSSADAGVWGEGEFALPELATRLERGQDWHDLANLVWNRDGAWQRNPPSSRSLADLPRMSRKWADNRRYFHEGGQAGFETKRGCPGECVYCADPVAKGKLTRTRPPAAVADEVERLLEQGIDHLHTCDGEFNLPRVACPGSVPGIHPARSGREAALVCLLFARSVFARVGQDHAGGGLRGHQFRRGQRRPGDAEALGTRLHAGRHRRRHALVERGGHGRHARSAARLAGRDSREPGTNSGTGEAG